MQTDNWTHLGDRARRHPGRTAIINGGNGLTLSYGELDRRASRLARYLQALGLRPGDHIAMVLENNMRCFEIGWAALRSGLMLTPVNRFLTPAEAAYIIADSQSRVVISSHAMRELAEGLSGTMPDCHTRLMVDGTIDGWDSYEQAIAAMPDDPPETETLGALMLYSSGTTGRPKGIIRAQPSQDMADYIDPFRRRQLQAYGFFDEMVYLSTAPLYHSAPLAWALQVQAVGGTVVFMEKFDAMASLALIERYRVTHSQWVPTMFVRLLKLGEHERHAFDLSSLRMAVHAAAPCPLDMKLRMIEWWGPIIHEYYGATEGCGLTMIDSEDYLAHPGSVGRAAVGVLHICDDDGRELPPGEPGLIYFERDAMPFRYHNDPARTDATRHPHHPTWTAVGDMGYVDDDGYLYLTDRKTFMIISGGVNIYPQAIEDALVTHEKVADAAVIGVPDAEMGEQVKAIIEPAPGVTADAALGEELIGYLRGKVARYMVPRTVDFIDRMPRLPTGKLYKQELRERYGAANPASTR
ncbi:Long-chain fatty acid--CoA ligase [Cupriavidus taiwanensis]|uniref:acyl-CoA synthetase n=1 Tax=Cupriavidus taiwanensis TaxID=164546 RepID=UPI000E1172EE|nr:acyl-CoA synthetase [Cupriavidus taiwanensis]SPA39638.1 Long-chain fatty acid--CoA ligase [Cupriavidus taiwanensis]